MRWSPRVFVSRESLGALVLAAAIPFLFVDESRQPELEIDSGLVHIGPSDVAVVVVLLAGLVASFRLGSSRLNAARVLWIPGIALIGWLAFQAFRPVAVDDARFEDHLVSYGELVGVSLMALAVPMLVRRGQDLAIVVAGIVLWSFVATVVALAQFLGVDVFDAAGAGLRQASFLTFHDLAALSVLAAGVAAAGIVATRKRIPAAALFPVALVGGALGLVLAGSIAAIVGFAIGALVITFAARSRFAPSGRQLLALVALVVIVAIGVTTVRAGSFERLFESIGIADESGDEVEPGPRREVLGYIGLRIFQDHPLLGVGWQRSGRAEVFDQYLDDARARYPDEADDAFPAADRELGVQSLYIQMLADAGLVGLVLLLAVGAGGLVLCSRTAAYASSPWAAGAGLAVMCSLLALAGEWALVGMLPGIPLHSATCLLLGLAAAGAATVEEESGG